MSHSYSTFGGFLASDLTLPELSPAECGAPDWTLRMSAQPLSPSHGKALGVVAKGACEIALWRTDSGYRMRHSCVGEYDITPDGTAITCWRYAGATDVAVQNDVVNRILPLLFHTHGALCLHASAVVVDGSAIVFVADARFGKSTLAYALVRAGALVASDDVAILATQPAVVMRPGVDHLRVRRDATAQLGRKGALCRSPLDGKDVLQFSTTRRVSAREISVAAVYILAPVARGSDASVLRSRIAERAATMLLMRHSRMGRMLCGADGGEMLRRAAAVARQVPVYVLHVVRDLGRIDDVACRVLKWHDQSATLSTGTDG